MNVFSISHETVENYIKGAEKYHLAAEDLASVQEATDLKGTEGMRRPISGTFETMDRRNSTPVIAVRIRRKQKKSDAWRIGARLFPFDASFFASNRNDPI